MRRWIRLLIAQRRDLAKKGEDTERKAPPSHVSGSAIEWLTPERGGLARSQFCFCPALCGNGLCSPMCRYMRIAMFEVPAF